MELQSTAWRKKWFPHKQPHLSVSLDLGVNKSPQNVGCDWKVDEDKLRLLMKAEQGEVVTQLHRQNGIFLLLRIDTNTDILYITITANDKAGCIHLSIYIASICF